MAEHQAAGGPDLAAGVALSEIPDQGVLAGHVGDEAVILARTGRDVVALGGHCTHYGAPLAEGLRVGDTLRCPWHHACFSLKTGQALGAPAFAPLDRWKVELKGQRVFVRHKDKAWQKPLPSERGRHPKDVLIVGGGAAGFAAAERLRGLGFRGRITLLSADSDGPYDRPNLSKDYLAGTAPEDWIPLRDAAFYREQKIELRLNATVVELDAARRRVRLADGKTVAAGAILLATGAEPIVPDAPRPGPDVFTLRSLADCRAIIARAASARSVVVAGASFIGLEVAGALRARGLQVHVVAPDAVPMQKALGAELGRFIQGLHEEHGVRFHLGRKPSSFEGGRVRLDDGSEIAADMVVLGVGVRPRTALAEAAGLRVEQGVVVDRRLRTSAAGVWAAGDIAAYPDPITGELVRVEHWVAAERQGQIAAADMLGVDARMTTPPFFWSHHWGVEIRYSGHATGWDAVEIEGSLETRDCEVRYLKAGRVAAVATLGRDRACLTYEAKRETEAAG